MNTLLLDLKDHDLLLDASGNIALASDPYAITQDVASAIKVFAGECYYDTRLGIPYLENVLGQRPSLQYLKSQIEAAALTVPGVVAAICTITGFIGRALGGNVRITDSAGIETIVIF